MAAAAHSAHKTWRSRVIAVSQQNGLPRGMTVVEFCKVHVQCNLDLVTIFQRPFHLVTVFLETKSVI